MAGDCKWIVWIAILIGLMNAQPVESRYRSPSRTTKGKFLRGFQTLMLGYMVWASNLVWARIYYCLLTILVLYRWV